MLIGTRPNRISPIRSALRYLLGHLAQGPLIGKSEGTAADGPCGASTGAAERMAAQVGALAATTALACPDKRRGIRVPAASGFFDPANDVLWGGWCRAI
jgi:hypothetical protein